MTIINSQLGGTKPSGTKQITTNGTHDVAGYANADVQVPTTAPAHYVEKAVDANGTLINGTHVIDLTGVTDVAGSVLSYAYTGAIFPENTIISLNPLTNISGIYAFQNTFAGCSRITGVNLSSLITISGTNACQQMFYSGINIASINLSSLTTISGTQACKQMFYGCKTLTSVTFDSLSILTGANALQQMFANCSALISLSFPALKSTSFDSQTNQFNSILQGVTGCTIHFPSNLDPQGGSTVISSLSGYPNFGGTNTVLAFDLPATES